MEPNATSFQKGKLKTGGRLKGHPNATTVSVKAALMKCYKGMGGDAAFIRWAKTEPTEFYKLYAKLLPKEIDAKVEANVNATISVNFV